MKKIIRKEAVIGLLVIIALAILCFGINYLKGVNIFKPANYFYANYHEVSGLSVSAPVMLNGYKVGVVRNISYNYDNPGNVLVEFNVDKALKISHGSTAVVSTDILGTASLVLKLGNQTDGFYNVGDTIPGEVDGGLMATLSEGVLPSVGKIMSNVDTLLVNLNKVAANPSLGAALNRFDNISAQLEASLQSFNKTLAQLPPVAADVKSITENVDTITGNLAHVSGTLREMPVDSLVRDLQATLANLHALSDELNNPDSTLGKLMQDPSLYNSLNGAIGSLDSLLVDVKRNPKRYISIKLF